MRGLNIGICSDIVLCVLRGGLRADDEVPKYFSTAISRAEHPTITLGYDPYVRVNQL
jgi:hypothetical protein